MTDTPPAEIEPTEEDLEPWSAELFQLIIVPSFLLRRDGRVDTPIHGGQTTLSAYELGESFDLAGFIESSKETAVREAIKQKLTVAAQQPAPGHKSRAERRQESREMARQLAAVPTGERTEHAH